MDTTQLINARKAPIQDVYPQAKHLSLDEFLKKILIIIR